MAAYLWSEELPIVLCTTDLDAPALRSAVERLMSEGHIVAFPHPSDDEAGQSDALVINFGMLAGVQVSAGEPQSDKPIMHWTQNGIGDVLS